jgi:homospermidine synthase
MNKPFKEKNLIRTYIIEVQDAAGRWIGAAGYYGVIQAHSDQQAKALFKNKVEGLVRTRKENRDIGWGRHGMFKPHLAKQRKQVPIRLIRKDTEIVKTSIKTQLGKSVRRTW